MRKLDEKENIQIKGMGWGLSHYYRSSAVSPFMTFFFIITVGFLLTAIFMDWKEPFYIWVIFVASLFIVLLITLKYNPNLLMSEGYNYNLKVLETMGEKGKGLQPYDISRVFQPDTKSATITGKAKIVKK
ncbi:hypothetical protein KBC70_01970 [Candidatus Woesebacteria bacterium]|nr:hypothetical protein [Candidatus Woesebacteria bacterium]